jgi:hypothetical protein
VPSWVGVDAEARPGAGQACGTQRQHRGLSLGDVAELEVRVDLRWKSRVRPARGLVARDTLEAQAAAIGITYLCPVVLSPGDRQAQQPRVNASKTAPRHGGSGQSKITASPVCRQHHRAKQAPGWRLCQDQPGVITWRLPHGRTYLTIAEPLPV